MDYRSYLALEVALTRRLQRSWTAISAPTYTAIATACTAGDFEAARLLVKKLDMTQVGTDNRAAIKYLLLTLAVFGAGLASDQAPNFISVGNHDQVLNNATVQILTYFATSGTQQAQEEALQSIAEAEVPAQKADEPEDEQRFVKPFVSFAAKGNDQIQLISSLNSSRLASWGFLAEADTLKMTTYQLVAVLDGRTSKFCELINGTIFQVADARKLIDTALSAQDPNDLKTIQPWPDQSKASLAKFAEMSPEELVASGYFVPPFHPNCRTLLAKVGTVKPKRTTYQVSGALPQEMQSTESFREMGLTPSDNEIHKWNSVVGLSPVQVTSALAQVPMQDVLEGNLKKTITFMENGNIGINVGATTNDIKAQLGTIFDPFTKKFYLTRADLVTGDPEAERDYVKKLLSNMIDVGSGAKADAIVIAVGAGQAASFAKLGFLPNPLDWQYLRDDALHNQDFIDAVNAMPEKDQATVMALIQSNDEASLEVLTEIPYTYHNRTLAEILLQDFQGQVELNLGDNFAVDKAKEYLS